MKTFEMSNYELKELSKAELNNIEGGLFLKVPMWLKVSGTIAGGAAAGYGVAQLVC